MNYYAAVWDLNHAPRITCPHAQRIDMMTIAIREASEDIKAGITIFTQDEASEMLELLVTNIEENGFCTQGHIRKRVIARAKRAAYTMRKIKENAGNNEPSEDWKSIMKSEADMIVTNAFRKNLYKGQTNAALEV